MFLESGVQSFDLDGVGSIPAVPRRRLPALLIISINKNDDDYVSHPIKCTVIVTVSLLLNFYYLLITASQLTLILFYEYFSIWFIILQSKISLSSRVVN
jgi:hypothetical protein